MSPIEDDPRVDSLYDAALSDFVAERNALAKQLRADGDRKAADAVRALEKPSIAAWVVNQIARRDGDLLGRIIDAGNELREAQRSALTGGDPDAVREALTRERKVVNEAVVLARQILTDNGLNASPTQLDRIGDTFYALASNDLARKHVRRGRLTHEVQRVGFGDFEVPEDALVSRRPSPSPDEEAVKKREALEAKLERARERAERLEQEARQVRERAEQAERVARDAADEVAELEQELAAMEAR